MYEYLCAVINNVLKINPQKKKTKKRNNNVSKLSKYFENFGKFDKK